MGTSPGPTQPVGCVVTWYLIVMRSSFTFALELTDFEHLREHQAS